MAPLPGFRTSPTTMHRGATLPDAEIVELPLLLPRWQAQLLEEAANEYGLTPGQMVRRLINDTLSVRKSSG